MKALVLAYAERCVTSAPPPIPLLPFPPPCPHQQQFSRETGGEGRAWETPSVEKGCYDFTSPQLE